MELPKFKFILIIYIFSIFSLIIYYSEIQIAEAIGNTLIRIQAGTINIANVVNDGRFPLSETHTYYRDQGTNWFIFPEKQKADVKVEVISSTSSRKLTPIWTTTNIHLLPTFFNIKTDGFETQGWLTNIFPYFDTGRITCPWGGMTPETVGIRSGETYFEPYTLTGGYNFGQHNRWMRKLLISGISPEIGIKSIVPDLTVPIESDYKFHCLVSAPIDPYTYVNYISDFEGNYAREFPTEINNFIYHFWHEPELTYSLKDCKGWLPGCGNTLEERRQNNKERFESYYTLYKTYYDYSHSKYGEALAAPVFLGSGHVDGYGEVSWLESFLSKAQEDNLLLPYIGVNIYVTDKLEHQLSEAVRLKHKYGYGNVPIRINETGTGNPGSSGASGDAYAFDLFLNNDVERFNTWLVNHFFQYNYWQGPYQDYRNWIRTPASNFYMILHMMRNTDYYDTKLMGELDDNQKVGIVITKSDDNKVFVLGYNHKFADEYDKQVIVDLDLINTGVTSNAYILKTRLIDKNHSNFFPVFCEDWVEFCSRDEDGVWKWHALQGPPKLELSVEEIKKYQNVAELELVGERTIGKAEFENLQMVIPPHGVVQFEIIPVNF